MTSQLNVDTISAKNGTSPVTLTKQDAVKTWNTLDGTGTIGILDSLNIASVTDSATGRSTPTFTANMGNTNYCSTNGSSRNGLFSTTVEGDSSYEAATGSVPTASTNASNAFTDTDAVMIAMLGDLA